MNVYEVTISLRCDDASDKIEYYCCNSIEEAANMGVIGGYPTFSEVINIKLLIENVRFPLGNIKRAKFAEAVTKLDQSKIYKTDLLSSDLVEKVGTLENKDVK